MTTSKKYTPKLEVPYGYCHCGCGQKTSVARQTRTKQGIKKGEPRLFLPSHKVVHTIEHQIEAFWDKVKITADDNQCWEWTAAKDRKGYGVTRIIKKTAAHRFAWIFPDYVIPDGMYILHSCDNPSCCNPKHLFLGTAQDNMDDKVKKGRQPRADSHPRRKLSSSKVIEIRRRYANGETSFSRMAKEYGVHSSTIRLVISRKNWPNV